MMRCTKVAFLLAALTILTIGAEQNDIMDETTLLQTKMKQNKRATTMSSDSLGGKASTDSLESRASTESVAKAIRKMKVVTDRNTEYLQEFTKGNNYKANRTKVTPQELGINTTGSKCATAMSKWGNMSYIGSDLFTAKEDFPAVNAGAYYTISMCLSAPLCDPSNLTLLSSQSGELRSIYATYAGSPTIDLWMEKLQNVGLMDSLYAVTSNATKAEFEATQAQLLIEVGMQKTIAGWFADYATLFLDVNADMDQAFTTMLTLLDMPTSSSVAKGGHSWVDICVDVLETVGSIVEMAGGIDYKNSDDWIITNAVGASLESLGDVIDTVQAISDCVQDCSDANSGGLSTPTPDVQAADKGAMEFSELIAFLMLLMSQILRTVVDQQRIIALNWGRSKAAVEFAGGCALNPVSLAASAFQAYGAMQWIALGVLMPNKYQIYWQRDYGGSKGPSCYYNGDDTSKKASTQNGCMGSDMGCWSPPSGSWSYDWSEYYSCGHAGRDLGTGGETSCFSNTDSGGGQSCFQTNRYIWVGEVGAPSNTPPADFFTGLTDPTSGPIATYVNTKYGTSYADASGGFQTFVTQCMYMPKLYIPQNSDNSISYSTSNPSQVPLPCHIYGISMETFAFPDCGTNLDIPGQGAGLTGTCVNGYGSSFGATSSMWGSGNYNQKLWIPNQKNHYASNTDGQLACCIPWESALAAGCDYMLCDCWSLAQGGNNNWLNEDTSGQAANSGSWWGSCEVDTDLKSTAQMMTTSQGPACNWTVVIQSENNFAACR